MDIPRHIILLFALVSVSLAVAAPLKDNIQIDALIATKAELRRHMSAQEEDRFKPATYTELEASRGTGQPDYLVLRFLARVPGHYHGEVEAKVDGAKGGTKVNVVIHFNSGWVEYFIPLDGRAWRIMEYDGDKVRRRAGSPAVIVEWNSLNQQ